MKEFIFIPDTNKNSGLGHFFRCLNYSKFINSKNKITFFIKRNFNKKYLRKSNIKYYYYDVFNSINTYLKNCKSSSKIIIIDSYKKKFTIIILIKYLKKYPSLISKCPLILI